MARISLSLLLILLLACSCSKDEPAPNTETEQDTAQNTSTDTQSGSGSTCKAAPTHTGEATFYAADGSGNCSFPASPGDLNVAALNTTDYAGAALCGACVQVSGPKGSVVVRIVDRCPGCAEGDIDLSAEAFAQIAEPSAGRVAATWQEVPCKVEGPVRYHFKDGSNAWWTAVQVRNHRHRIATFEVKGSDGNFKAVERVNYNYFVDSSGMGEGPYHFRITDIHGQSLEDTGVGFVENGEQVSAGQLPLCASP